MVSAAIVNARYLQLCFFKPTVINRGYSDAAISSYKLHVYSVLIPILTLRPELSERHVQTLLTHIQL